MIKSNDDVITRSCFWDGDYDEYIQKIISYNGCLVKIMLMQIANGKIKFRKYKKINVRTNAI